MLVLAAVWMASLAFPVFDADGILGPGGWFLAFGWMGLIVGDWAWLANPAFFLALLLLWFGRMARPLGIAALGVLALVLLGEALRTSILTNEGGLSSEITQRLTGYYLWIIALSGAVLLGATQALRHALDARRPRTDGSEA
ncbi:hypothetical protein [Stakelama tenebrarum]|uniref:Uncharacterized protein n=1 Tax=Stakelama tenebrarum TaxID=2711215 RepID=A0A6G6Y8Q2_9SPHN|nr:hypothetical protein [Sphingosinithalassobacter tenebrarum]QIG81314.1 hypothetical protein G5C33_17020 [Sphingosinithalassobacter tenebrarum]